MTDRAPPVPVGGLAWQDAQLVKITTLTPRIKSFVFALPRPFAFRAGQHVDLRLTAPDGYQAMRSYSIASAPDGTGRIELAIELIESGEVSPFFHAVAAVGDSIELRGPLGGHFVWSPQDGGPLLLVGGGAGLVPLLAMLRQRQATGSTVPVLLLLSTRTLAETPYRDELLAMEALGNGMTLRLAVTRGAPGRDVDYGRRVDAPMLDQLVGLLPRPPRHVFICGTNGFVNTVADGLVAAGIAPDAVRTERYGG